MRYENIKEGIFLSRPNRFIAEVEIDGKIEICHVKNTGRCKELLVAGAKVFVQGSDNFLRKTKYDLISVYKDGNLFNIDSMAPNKVFGEFIERGGYFGTPSFVKPECRYKNSRFDFYIETSGRKIFAEVKGVTLEEDGVFMFPDAPTERGVKHLDELKDCVKEGFEGYAVFIVQANEAKCFMPNRKTHKAFADALLDAEKNGVKILCFSCNVAEDEITLKDAIKVILR